MLPFFKEEQKELSQICYWISRKYEDCTIGNLFDYAIKLFKYSIIIAFYLGLIIITALLMVVGVSLLM